MTKVTPTLPTSKVRTSKVATLEVRTLEVGGNGFAEGIVLVLHHV